MSLEELKSLCKQWRKYIDNNKEDIDDEYYFKQNLLDIMDMRDSLIASNIIKREDPPICEYDLSGLIIGYTMIHDKEVEEYITKYADYWINYNETK